MKRTPLFSLLALAAAASLIAPQAAHAQGYTLKTLASFTSTKWANPLAGLTNVKGILYGTTQGGGGSGDNDTIFALVPTAQAKP